MTHTISHCHLDSEWQPWLGLGDKGLMLLHPGETRVPQGTHVHVMPGTVVGTGAAPHASRFLGLSTPQMRGE